MTLYHCWFEEADETADTESHTMTHEHGAGVDGDDGSGGGPPGGNGGGSYGVPVKGKGKGKNIPVPKPKPKPKAAGVPKAKTPQQRARAVSWMIYLLIARIMCEDIDNPLIWYPLCPFFWPNLSNPKAYIISQGYDYCEQQPVGDFAVGHEVDQGWSAPWLKIYPFS